MQRNTLVCNLHQIYIKCGMCDVTLQDDTENQGTSKGVNSALDRKSVVGSEFLFSF